LLRAAAVGGGAYLAGKRHARHSAQDQQAEEEQNARGVLTDGEFAATKAKLLGT
jgi:hypothetical protein